MRTLVGLPAGPTSATLLGAARFISDTLQQRGELALRLRARLLPDVVVVVLGRRAFGSPAVDGMSAAPVRREICDEPARSNAANADAGRSYVLPSTASVIALKLSCSEKCRGCPVRSAAITTAVSSPTFSMW